ncbi:MAG TPA: hypothetical protein VKT49_03690 [Bryobacteraceae bacterium]|nr:hypothetical protein [Bryobacteraceae bacterium]
MAPAPAPKCSAKEQLIRRIRLVTDTIVAINRAEMEAVLARNALIEKTLERRLTLARQDRTHLLASLREHVSQHNC